ncbi:MAG TPA: nucleotide pyrophosphohydrolase [Methylophaga aminisulfidivorans]|nr:nucleotide pyrophosphohydrolase [Methylophaga aminisulfidivorans]
MQKKASSVGFDWTNIDGVFDKIHEELNELQHEVKQGTDKAKCIDEFGDILFACCNLARHLDIDPKTAIDSTNRKFYRRFNYVETRVVSTGKTLEGTELSILDSLWDEAKQLEKRHE